MVDECECNPSARLRFDPPGERRDEKRVSWLDRMRASPEYVMVKSIVKNPAAIVGPVSPPCTPKMSVSKRQWDKETGIYRDKMRRWFEFVTTSRTLTCLYLNSAEGHVSQCSKPKLNTN